MNIPSCPSPLTWNSLLEYWLGELDPDSEARTEEHYLGCEQCSQRLERLIALMRSIREPALMSSVNFILNKQLANKLKERGLHIREYHVPCNGAVNCTVTTEDDFVLAHLEGPLDAVQQLDMVYVDGEGKSQLRLNDIPFNDESGCVIFSTSMSTLLALPATIMRIRLLAIDSKGERTIGEYTFNHTPSRISHT